MRIKYVDREPIERAEVLSVAGKLVRCEIPGEITDDQADWLRLQATRLRDAISKANARVVEAV